ncbi:MAG TPA: YdeI/OmpD-associated family protein [Thermoanaerobaculia bacterium]|nr:YdeI/OmpD-associated family protein [Thermoanaerobaculia bacterium]
MSAGQAEAVISFPTREAWLAWLAEHHATSPGLWLAIAKKGAAAKTVSYTEAIEGALCYGWIDGQKGKLDDERWRQRFTPRRSRSKWSKINRDKAAELIAQGRMKPAGLVAVERAKADGRWDAAYAGQKTATVPDDLERALRKNPKAREFFSTLDSANRYAILYRLQDAKKPETRARRLEKFVAMLGEHKKIHP